MIEYIHMFAHDSLNFEGLISAFGCIFIHLYICCTSSSNFNRKYSISEKIVTFRQLWPKITFFDCYSLYWSASRMRQKIYLLWNSHHLHVILVHTQVQDYLVCKTVFSAIEYSNHNGIVFDTNWFALINKWIEILCP